MLGQHVQVCLVCGVGGWRCIAPHRHSDPTTNVGTPDRWLRPPAIAVDGQQQEGKNSEPDRSYTGVHRGRHQCAQRGRGPADRQGVGASGHRRGVRGLAQKVAAEIQGNATAIAEQMKDPVVRQKVLDRADEDTKRNIAKDSTRSVPWRM